MVEPRGGEAGFALILAMFTLLIMTFLGLAVATTTSSELQISSNFKWEMQALYNAESGIEMGKGLLRNMNWSLILPPARPGYWAYTDTPVVPTSAPYSRPDADSVPSRNYEGGPCDHYGHGMGYGVVLDDGGGFGPYQNVTAISGNAVNGTFTLWIRHEVDFNAGGNLIDVAGRNTPDDTLILTAEGSAPYTRYEAGSRRADINRATRFLEVTLSRGSLTTPCGTRGGQVGGGPEGSNFSPCDPITNVGSALVGAARTENSTAQ